MRVSLDPGFSLGVSSTRHLATCSALLVALGGAPGCGGGGAGTDSEATSEASTSETSTSDAQTSEAPTSSSGEPEPGTTSSGGEAESTTGEPAGCAEEGPPGSVEEAVQLYTSAWVERDPQVRACTLARVWAEDGRYVDPMADASGREGLSAVIDGLQALGDISFERTTQIDSYDEALLRFGWKLLDGEGGVLAEGIDFGRLDAEGRLAAIHGFFGPLPPLGPVPPLFEDYAAAWNTADPDKRVALLQGVWSEDGVYRDPTATAEGAAALSEVIAEFLLTFPDHALVMTSAVDQHHDVLRFGWQIETSGGELVLEGLDFGQLDEEGRLRRIWGFFGPLAPL
jgi:hypothetical protein